jgi:hypothetical protein
MHILICAKNLYAIINVFSPQFVPLERSIIIQLGLLRYLLIDILLLLQYNTYLLFCMA